MKQSPNDTKKYQAITLDNGLRVLLIQNNETDKAAAALAVNVGHFQDPKERQGLAHFLEHMLFLGTKKYPNGSEYQQFISQHGGSNNAWTGTEHTCFFFDIQQQYFPQALDRFSQFFIAPLLGEEFASAERNNVDAEFKMKLKDDIRRLYDVHKETINPDHPFAQFSVGNVDTLADRNHASISIEVRHFFEQYYRAQYMTLAIEGPQPLHELALLAKQYFTLIKSTSTPLAKIENPLYLEENQGIKIDVCPIKNAHQLIVSFALESIDKYYQDKPESILAYLLGHEGTGSILSLLKMKQWAMSLTAGSGINGSNFKDFNISIALTELGEQHINDIIDIVFTYLYLLKQKPLAQHYYQEKQVISDLAFIYQEKMRPIDSVSQLVINMQHYPESDYIYGDYKMSGLNLANIDTLLAYFNADNLRVTHISQQNAFSKTSHWYQVPYHVSKLSTSLLARWQQILQGKLTTSWLNSLALPRENPYIVQQPIVYSDIKDEHGNLSVTPKKIVDESGLAVWFKQDNTFKVPKGYIYVGIDSPISIASSKNVAMTRLFVDLYTETVIEENYDAELAGIHYHLYAHQGGVTLQVSGMSEKQNLLLGKLLSRLKSHQVNEEHFLLFKKQLIKHWRDSDKSKSISILFSKLSSLLQPNTPCSDDLANALEQVTYFDYCHFTKQLFTQINIEVLIHGNWLSQDAKLISNNIKHTFNSSVSDKNTVTCPVIDTDQKGTLLLPVALLDHDHAIVTYKPMQNKDHKTTALTLMTSHILSPLFFQEMRTEKQYGYLVGVGYVPINSYPGIAFYIQSPHVDPTELSQEIDGFINQCLFKLEEIDDRQWQHLSQGLASQLQEKDQNLRIKSQRFWAAISNKHDTFQQKEQLLSCIRALTLTDVTAFIKTQLLTESHPDRVLIFSCKQQAATSSIKTDKQVNPTLSGQIITNPRDFTKKTQRKY